MDFVTWRDLAAAFVQVEARRVGAVVRSVRVATTGSAYVYLRCGCRRACVRLSDHRSSSIAGRSGVFSVRQVATRKLDRLGVWLRGRLAPVIAQTQGLAPVGGGFGSQYNSAGRCESRRPRTT